MQAVIQRPLERGRTAPIDGLRAIAFVWVFQVHAVSTLFVSHKPVELLSYFGKDPWYPDFVLKGHFGVDIFHIIGALLSTRALIATYNRTKVVNVASFIKKRFIRIIPVYYTFLILTLIIHYTGETIPGVRFSFTNFLFINNYVSFGDQFMPHTWTQGVEMQFTLLLPLLFRALLSFARENKPTNTSRNTHVEPSVNESANSPSDGSVVNRRSPRAGKRPGELVDVRRFVLAIEVLLFLSWFIRIVASLYLVSRHPNYRLPMPLSDVDWFSQKLPPSVLSFYSMLYLPLPSRMSSFLLGVLVALLLEYPRQAAGRTMSRLWIPCNQFMSMVAFLLIAVSLVPPLTSHSMSESYSPNVIVFILSTFRLSFGLGVAMLLYWCLNLRRASVEATYTDVVYHVDSVLAWKGWFPIASLSYPAYLFHILVLGGVNTALKSTPSLLEYRLNTTKVLVISIVSFAITMLLSLVVHLLVEAPSQNLRARLFSDRSGTSTPSPSPSNLVAPLSSLGLDETHSTKESKKSL